MLDWIFWGRLLIFYSVSIDSILYWILDMGGSPFYFRGTSAWNSYLRGNYSANWWRHQGMKSLSNPPSGRLASRAGFKPKPVFLQSTRSFHWPCSFRPHAQPQCSVPGIIISLVGASYPCLGAWFWVNWSVSISEKWCCIHSNQNMFSPLVDKEIEVQRG